jgi:hypothetical protein
MTRRRITTVTLTVIVLIVGFGFAVLINNKRQNAAIAKLSARIVQQEEDLTRQPEVPTTVIREQRDQLDRQRIALEISDGDVTSVDDERREVVINITRRQGARCKPSWDMTWEERTRSDSAIATF